MLIVFSLSSFAGSATGTALLFVSKAMGSNKYKPLMTFFKEDLTEEQKNKLCETVKEEINNFATGSMDSAVQDSAEEDSAEEDSAEEDSAEEDSAEMDSAEQDSAEEDSA